MRSNCRLRFAVRLTYLVLLLLCSKLTEIGRKSAREMSHVPKRKRTKQLSNVEEIRSWCENIEALEKMYINNQILFGQHLDDRLNKNL